MQIADYPGRHEPETGNVDFAALFAALEQRGYPEWIGSGSTVANLTWSLDEYLLLRVDRELIELEVARLAK